MYYKKNLKITFFKHANEQIYDMKKRKIPQESTVWNVGDT